MIDLVHIREHSIPIPETYTIFGSPNDVKSYSPEHRDQIVFLDKAASTFIYEYAAAARLVTGEPWQPFSGATFKFIEEYSQFGDDPESAENIKKWLFNRGIAFRNWVFILPTFNDYPVCATWKMVIKYWNKLFFSDDLTIFDGSLNWSLFYYHEDRLIFGRDNIYDPSAENTRMAELDELKRKFHQLNFPY
ncbi:MAG: hypothetical protein EOP49_34565 [Sphingobacteriales bacterium]|nr:MAG: hypothetical protein EOP49_34565 [Sphingobacteriales bacterium]